MRSRSAGGRLTAEEHHTDHPRPDWVRIDVRACGVCRADLATLAADRSTDTPVTPGHEIAGTIAEVGNQVVGWQPGDRVAVGWFGGSCRHCASCQRGDVLHCPERKIPGLHYPGGWSESVAVPANALARVPDGLDFSDAAPMGCAGVTTFNAVRRSSGNAGARIAVFGVGGLGHLAVQFAAAMGYEVVAIARGSERAGLAFGLGAHHYVDSGPQSAGEALQQLGGVDVVLCTAPATAPLGELITGLRPRGRLVLIGTDTAPIELPVGPLVMGDITISGHHTGSATDIEDTMDFAVLHGIRPMVERLPLSAAQDAVERLAAGKPRFRIVLEPTLKEARD